MFQGPIFPGWYVTEVPGFYVTEVLCFKVLCSPDPMFQWSHMFTVCYAESPMFLVSNVPVVLRYQGTRVLCSWGPMFPISTYVLSTRSQALWFKLFGRLMGVDQLWTGDQGDVDTLQMTTWAVSASIKFSKLPVTLCWWHLAHLEHVFLQSAVSGKPFVVIWHMQWRWRQSVCMSVYPSVCVKYGRTVRNQGMSFLRQASCLSLLYAD